jgi:hypothetical protein
MRACMPGIVPSVPALDPFDRGRAVSRWMCNLFSDWSPIYEVRPACVTVSSRMILQLPFSNREGAVPSGLTTYHAKDRNSLFKPLTNVEINAGFSEAAIAEFGLFFVGVLKSPGQLNCP